MNINEIRLKPADSPAPTDPQTVAIEHMQQARALAEEARHLVKLLTRWGEDPVAVFRRAQTSAIELSQQAAQLEAGAESMLQSYRLSGLFSTAYSTDLGPR